ncbi:hypothetical protein KC315_g13922 [Hortaea werneckii]|nr:hypothetical protein KC315_g13922 [Hortaea werneckii]
MATGTPRLDTIAPELLQTILGFISGPDTSDGGTLDVEVWRFRSLHALAMTSKQLHYETVPYLYRRFETRDSDTSLAVFARSLCENAELAKCVQVFDAFNVSTTQSQLPNPRDIKILKAALVRLKLAKISSGIEVALDKHCACAFYLLLISLTTRLKCLKLSFYSSVRQPGRLRIQLHNDEACPCCCSFNESLQKIFESHIPGHQHTNLEMFQFGPHRDGDVGLLAAVSQLPVMKNIILMSFGDVSESYDWTGRTNLSSVEDIHMEYGFLPSKDVAGLIACCKKLKSLLIWWSDYATDWEPLLPAIDTSIIMTALKSHRECLETLELICMTDENFVPSYPTYELPTFTALSKLDVDDRVLLEGRSWDSFELPPNLRVLVIYMLTPFIGFTNFFRAIGQKAQKGLADLTITIPFEGNEIHAAPFLGLHEVRGPNLPAEEVKVTHINTDMERPPWCYHLWTEEYEECVKMRFLGEDVGKFMDFCAGKVETHGVDFLINTDDYLSHSQSSHEAE